MVGCARGAGVPCPGAKIGNCVDGATGKVLASGMCCCLDAAQPCRDALDMPVGESPAKAFTSSLAWELLAAACDAWGLPSDGAKLLRLGENAIFRLAAKPLVLRIGRSLERLPIMDRELCVARWLDDEGVAVATPFDGVEQPRVVNGHPASVWHLVEEGKNRPGVEELAILLRQVHALSDCPCDIPALDPLAVVPQRIQDAKALDAADRAFLLELCSELHERYRGLEFALPTGFVHGDAHTGNLLGETGRAVLTDFEGAARGAREWDLIGLTVSRARFGLPDKAYRSFCELYGFDVTGWDGYSVLRQIRELYMTAWLIQNIEEGPVVAAEVALRIASIRDGDTSCEWHAF